MRDKKRILTLDFRTKLFMTFVLSCILLLGNLQQKFFPVAVIASLLPFFFLALEKRYTATIKGLILLITAFIIQKYYIIYATGIISSFFLFFCMLFLKMMPGIMMGSYTFASTNMSDLVWSLKKMKTPDVIVIPITVMARFFFTVSEDYSHIKEAMYLHGLTGRKLLTSPFKFAEYRMVPLLMCLTRTADEVAVSAMTRGLRVDGERSSISDTKLGICDYICFLLMFVLIGFFIGGKYV